MRLDLLTKWNESILAELWGDVLVFGFDFYALGFTFLIALVYITGAGYELLLVLLTSGDGEYIVVYCALVYRCVGGWVFAV